MRKNLLILIININTYSNNIEFKSLNLILRILKYNSHNFNPDRVGDYL